MLYKAECTVESLYPAPVEHAALIAERRKYIKAALLTCKVPLSCRPKVVKKRLIIRFCDNTNSSYTAVNHIGKREVDQAVSAAEEYRTHCSVLCHFAHCHIVHISKNKTKDITHIYVHSNSPTIKYFQK